MKGAVKFVMMFAITAFFMIAIGILGRFNGSKKAIVRISDNYELQEKGDTLVIIKK